ncbi:MAG: L-arabinose transport system permease protein AraQ [candidate division BRC1 bacterium ADurb.Bin183]|nr:MAG: L-arabinose transport system permease protein AraQ [candidate division BRC1 bacterium ADurb.Bin183]
MLYALIILMFLSLAAIVAAFILLKHSDKPQIKKLANTLFLCGEAYLLFHVLHLIISIIQYGVSDFSVLLTVGETYVLVQSFAEYTKRSRLRRKLIIAHAVVIIGSIAFLFPLVWMVSTALKLPGQAMSYPPKLIEFPMRFENFKTCLNYQGFQFNLYARNTLYLCILSVLGTILSSSLVAYGFSRIKWRGRDFCFYLTLATMMIPFPVYMIPLFRLFRLYNWVGTFKPLWIPAFFSSAFHVFLMRQFFMNIPHDLSEAAFMDGAGDFRIYWSVILPLAKPVLLVVGLFQFLNTWNDFLGPLIYLSDQKRYTLSLGLQFFQSQHGGTDWNLLMAASTLVIIPIVILFLCTQKTFLRGMTMSGLRGG